MKNIIKIDNYSIGKDSHVFMIAELSANHNQDISIAKESIYAIKESGANAVKLQTYTPDTITINSNKKFFIINQGTIWDGQTLYELYQKAYTPWEWHYELKEIAEKLDLTFFSTPFDITAVDFLETLNVSAYKIASFEITDIPLIKYAASKGKPVIISTGIATLADIEEAVSACRQAGCTEIALLKCVSAYPTPLNEVNLATIPHLAETFNVIPGLSDHTRSASVAVGAVALGARIIEKHFILDRSLGGPDAEFSLEPDEFKALVSQVREVEEALGTINYALSPRQEKARAFSRSLFVVKDMDQGEVFTKENVRSIRPGYGLHPRHFKDILGKRARVAISKGTPLSWNLVD